MPRVRKSDVRWVEPELVVEVEFVEWTHEGRLRFPTFLGLREDKLPEEVRREEPFPTEIRKGKRTLKFSNLDKVFWPDEGITKGDLLAYYREIAPTILPHLRDRPFTMKRYPDGIDGKFFFQKDAPKHMPEWIPTRRFEVSTRESPRQRRMIDAPLVNDELALLWMVNMACIDMNTWYSRVDKPDRPDWVLFDLDPSPDVGFPEVVEVALLVKSVLDGLGLEGFPKTSGADGMHVLVPIARRSTYAQAREFGEIVARTLASTHRGLVTTEWVKRKRRGVLIDANQNGEGKTIASAYSVRPAAGSARLDAAALGRGEGGPRPHRLHDGRRPAPGGEGRRPVLRRARGRAIPGAGARVGPLALSSRRGWPSVPSSAMSRRKKSATVQSVTTGACVRTSGSWLRWYVRVTNQPGKPRRRRPRMSAMPR